MFSYCRNNPIVRVDFWGTLDKNSEEVYGQNVENLLKMFGVDSEEDLPELPDNAMYFFENTTSISIFGVTWVHGRSIVMDRDKYCIYTFTGMSSGISLIPYDYSVTAGYVYNVDSIYDYCGYFYSGSINYVYKIEGGAISSSDVYTEILGGTGYGSGSIGVSVTYYTTSYSDWVYGKAPITWTGNTYNRFDPTQDAVRLSAMQRRC